MTRIGRHLFLRISLVLRLSPFLRAWRHAARPTIPTMGRAVAMLMLAVLLPSVLLPSAPPANAAGAGESVDQALCRLIDAAAAGQGLPADFLTRLIWRESSFRHHVVSTKGAQGIAQFMPGTAAERGLRDPFDPEQAIPAAASLLADLRRQFGNLGLAAAAYNAGPGRVQGFLSGRTRLPGETRTYVRIITGRDAEEWASARRGAAARPPDEKPPTDTGKDATAVVSPEGVEAAPKPDDPPPTCLTVVAVLRKGGRAPDLDGGGSFAPWGVQVAGAFSKPVALAAYQRALTRFGAAMGDAAPMIIGTRLPGRGRGAYYRVRLPAQTRAEANAVCARLHTAGGGCIVLAN